MDSPGATGESNRGEDLIVGKQGRTIFAVPDWLVSYRGDWVRFDILAGLTASAVVVPKAMAYASIAGLPVQAGLYTAFLPMIIYALLGTSRVLSISTTTTIAILTATQLTEASPNADPTSLLAATATLTLLVGGMLVIASVLRLGFLANFISEPVLIGFKAAIGVVIIVDQIPKILGIHIAHDSFFHSILAIVRGLSHTSLATFAVGISMVAILVLLEHLTPKIPAPLVAVVLSIAASSLLSLQTRGVSLVGHIPKGLPLILMPNISLAESLWPGALGIALMSFTETSGA